MILLYSFICSKFLFISEILTFISSPKGGGATVKTTVHTWINKFSWPDQQIFHGAFGFASSVKWWQFNNNSQNYSTAIFKFNTSIKNTTSKLWTQTTVELSSTGGWSIVTEGTIAALSKWCSGARESWVRWDEDWREVWMQVEKNGHSLRTTRGVHSFLVTRWGDSIRVRPIRDLGSVLKYAIAN